MTAAVILFVLALAVWVGGRLVAAERSRVELEAFRASLGLPADRCRIADVDPLQAWRTRRAIPTFATVYRSLRPIGATERVEVRR